MNAAAAAALVADMMELGPTDGHLSSIRKLQVSPYVLPETATDKQTKHLPIGHTRKCID